jgi:GNAT superfamily N-acetyltransferase
MASASLSPDDAGVADWLRDGFGPGAGFTVFVAEADDAATVIGMATCSQRRRYRLERPGAVPARSFRRAAHRHRGNARALLARVAGLARNIGSPIIELTVRADNPAAQEFYCRSGFPAGAAMPDLRAGRPAA